MADSGSGKGGKHAPAAAAAAAAAAESAGRDDRYQALLALLEMNMAASNARKADFQNMHQKLQADLLHLHHKVVDQAGQNDSHEHELIMQLLNMLQNAADHGSKKVIQTAAAIKVVEQAGHNDSHEHEQIMHLFKMVQDAAEHGSKEVIQKAAAILAADASATAEKVPTIGPEVNPAGDRGTGVNVGGNEAAAAGETERPNKKTKS